MADTERPFVFLEWLDSRLAAAWLDDDIELSPAICRSVGWIVKDDADYLAIAGTWSPTINEFAAVIVIPTSSIRRRIDLEWPLQNAEPTGGE
jgi:hypothetical protein